MLAGRKRQEMIHNRSISYTSPSTVSDHLRQRLVDVSRRVNSGLENGEEGEGSDDGSSSRKPSWEFVGHVLELVADGAGVDVRLGRSSQECWKSGSLLALQVGKTIIEGVVNIGALQWNNIELSGASLGVDWGKGRCRSEKADKGEKDRLHHLEIIEFFIRGAFVRYGSEEGNSALIARQGYAETSLQLGKTLPEAWTYTTARGHFLSTFVA